MLRYPIELEEDDGTIMVTSPEFPELTTFGEDRTEALARAVDAFDEAIAARIHLGREVPSPSRGRNRVTLPTLCNHRASCPRIPVAAHHRQE